MAPTANDLVPSRPTSPAPTQTSLADHEVEEETLQHCVASERLHQQTVRAHSHLKIANARPIFLTVNNPKLIKLRAHHEVFQDRFTSEAVTLLAYPRHQLDQVAFVFQFFTTPYERRICILAYATTAKRAVTSPVITEFGRSSDSRVTTLAKTVMPLQCISVGPYFAKVANVETCLVLPEVFQHREWWRRHDRCITKPKEIEFLIRIRRPSVVVRRTSCIDPRSQDRENIWCAVQIRHDQGTDMCKNRDKLT